MHTLFNQLLYLSPKGNGCATVRQSTWKHKKQNNERTEYTIKISPNKIDRPTDGRTDGQRDRYVKI